MPAHPLAGAIDGRRPTRQDRLVIQEALQVLSHLLSRGVALGRFLGNGFQYDGFQLHGNCAVKAARRGRVVEGNLGQQLIAVLAVEGRPQCQQLIQGDAERVDIGAVVHLAAPGRNLLGTHVAQRAQQFARHGQAGGALEQSQAEIGDPEIAAHVEQQVGRLDVAMDDAGLMCVFERLGRLLHELGNSAEKRRAPRGAFGGEGCVMQRWSLRCAVAPGKGKRLSIGRLFRRNRRVARGRFVPGNTWSPRRRRLVPAQLIDEVG